MMPLIEGLVRWRNAIIAIAIILLLSPLFAWAVGIVGYSEPLENVAERLGAMEHEYSLISGILPDYTVPGVNPHTSTLFAGIVGCVIVALLCFVMGKALVE